MILRSCRRAGGLARERSPGGQQTSRRWRVARGPRRLASIGSMLCRIALTLLGASAVLAQPPGGSLAGQLTPCRWAGLRLVGRTLADATTCDKAVTGVLKHYGVVEWAAGERQPSPHAAEPLPVVAIMSHREFVVGCHSFESLFSDRMPTYLVFSQEFAAGWGMGRLVTTLGASSTQLLAMQRVGGEVVAQSIVMDLIRAQRVQDPKYVFFTHCDIHPLPPAMQPRGFASYVQAVEELVLDFDVERELRASGRTAVRTDGEYGAVNGNFKRGNASCAALGGAERARMPVFAINTVLVESVRAPHDLMGSQLHGVDVGGYAAMNGLNITRHTRAVPAGQTSAGLPWLSDATTWLEEHALLIDAALWRVLHRSFPMTAAGDVLFHNEYYVCACPSRGPAANCCPANSARARWHTSRTRAHLTDGVMTAPVPLCGAAPLTRPRTPTPSSSPSCFAAWA